MPPNGPPPRPGHILGHPTSPPPPAVNRSCNRSQLWVHERLAVMREQLAAMQQQLAALQALSRDLQADAPPAATPYFVRGADGRNHYGKTLEEAQRLAAEGEYQEPQWTPRDTPWPVPWQQADGWEGRQ